MLDNDTFYSGIILWAKIENERFWRMKKDPVPDTEHSFFDELRSGEKDEMWNNPKHSE